MLLRIVVFPELSTNLVLLSLNSINEVKRLELRVAVASSRKTSLKLAGNNLAVWLFFCLEIASNPVCL